MPAVQTLQATRATVKDKIKSESKRNVERDIEESIYRYTVSHAKKTKVSLLWSNVNLRRIYTRKARSILSNMSAIDSMIESKKVSPKNVAFLSPYDIRPDIYNPIFDKIQKRQIMTELVDKEDDDDYVSSLRCPNCKSYNTRYTMYQCRSGDEPSNIFYRCLSCGTNDVIRP